MFDVYPESLKALVTIFIIKQTQKLNFPSTIDTCNNTKGVKRCLKQGTIKPGYFLSVINYWCRHICVGAGVTLTICQLMATCQN